MVTLNSREHIQQSLAGGHSDSYALSSRERSGPRVSPHQPLNTSPALPTFHLPFLNTAPALPTLSSDLTPFAAPGNRRVHGRHRCPHRYLAADGRLGGLQAAPERVAVQVIDSSAVWVLRQVGWASVRPSVTTPSMSLSRTPSTRRTPPMSISRRSKSPSPSLLTVPDPRVFLLVYVPLVTHIQ